MKTLMTRYLTDVHMAASNHGNGFKRASTVYQLYLYVRLCVCIYIILGDAKNGNHAFLA